MRISSEEWKEYALLLNEKTLGARVSKTIQFDGAVFLLPLGKSNCLYFSLSGDCPRVYLSRFQTGAASMNSSLSTALRKHLSGSKIEGVRALGGDSIVEFSLLGVDDIFQPVRFYLIAELIPYKGNLILLDEDRKVIASLYSGSLDSPRPLFRGLSYAFPYCPKAPPLSRQHIDYEERVRQWEKEEEAIAEKRKKNIYSSVFAKARKNVKTLQNRLKAIENDIISASVRLKEKEYGDILLTCLEEASSAKGEFLYEGISIPLDPNLSVSKNAEIYYRRYKKAKNGIEMAKERKAKTIEELAQAEDFLRLLELSSEEDLDKYQKELGGLESKGSHARYESSSSFFPYETFVEGTRYVYGKNARQNDFLETLMSKKGNAVWIHPKLGHGCHLVIDKDSPTDEETQLGCEICLLGSKLNSGEVMIAKKKDVRKGNALGQTIVKAYHSAMIRGIGKQAEEAYEKGEKIKP